MLNDELKLALNEKQLDIDSQRNEIMLWEQKISMLDEIKLQRDDALDQLESERDKRFELSEQIKKFEKDAITLRKKDEKCFESIQLEMQKIVDEKDDLNSTGMQKDIKIKSLMQTNLDLQSQLGSLN